MKYVIPVILLFSATICISQDVLDVENSSTCTFSYYDYDCVEQEYLEDCPSIIHIVTDPNLVVGGSNSLFLGYTPIVPLDYGQNCLYSGSSYNISAQFQVQVPPESVSELQSELDFSVYASIYKDGEVVNTITQSTYLMRPAAPGGAIQTISRPSHEFTFDEFLIQCVDPDEGQTMGVISILVDFGTVELEKYSWVNYNRFYFGRKPKYSLVIYIPDDMHGVRTSPQISLINESDSHYNPLLCQLSAQTSQELKYFSELNDSNCGHVNDHIVILDIPICNPIHKNIQTNVDKSEVVSNKSYD